MTGRCPHCRSRIDGLEAAGPGLHTVGPCGHFVDKTPIGALLDGSAADGTPDVARRRTTVQLDEDGLVIPDGGSPDDRDIDDISAVDACESCGWTPAAIVLVDGDWECYNCGHPPDGSVDGNRGENA